MAVSKTTEIRGPIPEYDKYGKPTGASYYACRGCGIEAMRKRDVREHCECGGSR